MIPNLDGDTVADFLERGMALAGDHASEISTVVGTTATTVNPAAGIFLSLTATGFTGIVQDKGVEYAAWTDRKLEDVIAELDEDPDRKRAALVWTLRQLTHALPDGEQWEEAGLQSVNGDPDQLVKLLREYQTDAQKRRQFETAFHEIVTGEIVHDSDEDLVEYLQEQLGVDDREDALGLFLDLQDLLVAREVHEMLDRLHDVSV